MVKRRLPGVLVVAGLLVSSQSQAIAQESLDLSVLDAGRVPDGPVLVSAIVNGQKVAVARTDAYGILTIDYSMLNLGRGTPVGVHLVTCQGTTELVLLPPGTASEDCDRARRDPDCDCRKLGSVYWYQTGAARVDLADGGSMVTADAPPEAAAAARAAEEDAAAAAPGQTAASGSSDWDDYLEGTSAPRFGLSMTWSNFTNLEDTACNRSVFEDLGSCSVDDSGIGFSGYYEFGNLWPGRPFFAGVGGGYKSVGVDQSYPGKGASFVELDIWQIDAYGGWRFPFAEVFEAFPMIGLSWMFNGADVRTEFDERVEVSRSENGIRMLLGAGLDWGLWEKVSLRGTIRWTLGGSDDADRNWEIGVGANYRLGN